MRSIVDGALPPIEAVHYHADDELAALRNKVAELSAIVDAGDALERCHGFDETLRQVIEQAKALLDAERAALYLYDAATMGNALLRTSFEDATPWFRQSPMPLRDVSIAVKVFRSGIPHLSNDVAHDASAQQQLRKTLGTRNCVVVPVDADDQRIGVLSVSNKRSGQFTEHDLSLLSALAPRFGVALKNSRSVDQERHRALEMERLNRENEQQRQALCRTFVLYDELMCVVRDGLGLGNMAAALSKFFDNPVALEDRFGNLLAGYPDESRSGLAVASLRAAMLLVARQATISQRML